MRKTKREKRLEGLVRDLADLLRDAPNPTSCAPEDWADYRSMVYSSLEEADEILKETENDDGC